MIAAVACWLAAEAVASVASSASCYDLVEDVRIVPVAESKRKLIQVQRQISLRHFVVVADDATLQQRPE
jgi:hypothetical protein